MRGFGLQMLKGNRDGARHPVDAFTDADGGKIINVPVDAIKPNPDQPRKFFDPQALHDLTDSVRDRGVLQPIIVRRNGEDAFILIAGERRWRAAKGAGLAKIPALVRQKEDSAEIAIIENLQRENLNPVEEAESLFRLKQQRSLSDNQLAKIVGKSRPSIVEALSLNKLPKPILQECRTSDTYTKSQLLLVLRQPSAEDQLAFWRAIKDGKLTIREARAKIAADRGTAPKARHYEHEYRPDNKAFTVRVRFRKARATVHDVKEALREALRRVH